MVGVRVGDQHGVERQQVVDVGQRHAAPHVGDPHAQQRVGQQARAVELDQQRGVADEDDPVAGGCGGHAARRCSTPRAARPSSGSDEPPSAVERVRGLGQPLERAPQLAQRPLVERGRRGAAPTASPPSAACVRASSQAASIGRPTHTRPSSGSTAGGAGTRIAAHSSPPPSSAASAATAHTISSLATGRHRGRAHRSSIPRGRAAETAGSSHPGDARRRHRA